MAYGEGRTRLYRDMAKEKSFELARYERELGQAETAQQKDVASGALWDFAGSALATAGMFAFGSKDPKSLLKAWQYGGEGGKWAHRAFSGYDPEDYAVTTDPGKFDVSQRYDFEDINRQFEEAERSRFYKDLTETGTMVASRLAFGAKGEAGVEGETNWWTKYMEDLFGKSEEDEVFVDLLAEADVYDNPDLRLEIKK
jgi:hypothetical protein